MIITPNNDAARVRPTTSALRRGATAWNADQQNLEHIEEEASPEMLRALRARLTAAEADAAWYFDRNRSAFDYWHARWAGQTVDGRKWGATDETRVWPWPGASDTRVRTTEMIINERLTVCMFALMNMKVQAESTMPVASMRESQQAGKLLNWQIFTQMAEEVYNELPLCMNWRLGLGSSIMEVTWEQETRLWMQPINLINLQALAQHNGMADQERVDQFISALFDPAGEEMAIAIVQSASPLVTKTIARKILKDLRDMRTAEIPVPEVIKSKPRWTALRTMVDVLFDARVGAIQRAPWVSRVEYVTETELMDRVELAEYSEDFVAQILDLGRETSRGVVPGGTLDWRYGTRYAGVNDDADSPQYRLEHMYQRGLRNGTPSVYCTVFNQNVDVAAKHAPLHYDHGEYPFAVFRNEHHDRAIVTSRGDAEIAYTWEQEIKKQRDARSDRTDLALKPPLLTTYEELIKMKSQFMPETIIPMRRFDDAKWFPAPPYDQGSIEIEKTVLATIDRFYGLFGDVDPALKQQRQQQLADGVLMEMKPVIRQTWQLMQQYLDDATVSAIVGPMQQPFNVGRKEIQGMFHITATVDMRTLDPAFLKEMLASGVQLVQLDTMGLIDRTKFIRILANSISYELAEAIQETEPATQKEQEDEMRACDLILATGVDQPMPMGGNYQLRFGIVQQKLQAYQQNPVSARRLQENPEILQVFQNRADFFQRQLQQRENAQIGRMQVTNTFDKAAPQQGEGMGAG